MLSNKDIFFYKFRLYNVQSIYKGLITLNINVSLITQNIINLQV